MYCPIYTPRDTPVCGRWVSLAYANLMQVQQTFSLLNCIWFAYFVKVKNGPHAWHMRAHDDLEIASGVATVAIHLYIRVLLLSLCLRHQDSSESRLRLLFLRVALLRDISYWRGISTGSGRPESACQFFSL